MKARLTFGSVCSGIEAASVAWHPLGWQAAWLAEIEPFPCAVLAHHYPDVPNLGDMKTIARRVLTGEVSAPDVFCGGTPCQAFSVAGLRQSLDDARGNLTLKFVEIANAIDHVRTGRGEDECIVFWENVPGVLSTKDNAFGCFLGGLAGEDGPLEPPGGKWANAGAVYGPKRAVAWRLFDAQFFALAQRRRRVFVVASARKGFDPAQVLFEWDGVRRDTAPSREARQVAPTIPARSTAGGGLGTDFDCDGGTICVATGQAGAEIGADMAPTLNCNHEAPYVAHPLRGEGFDASEDGAGRGTPLGPMFLHTNKGRPDGRRSAHTEMVSVKDIVETLTTDGHAQSAVAVPVAFAENSRHELRLEGGDGQRTGALSTGGGKPGQGVPMIAFPANLSGTQCASTEELAPAPVAFDQHYQPSTTAQTLIAGGSGGRNEMNHPTVFTAAMQVRRLTPTEAERLQGFEPGYTAIPWRGKPADQCPDGPRYKALGNSWAVPNVTWLGKRISALLHKT